MKKTASLVLLISVLGGCGASPTSPLPSNDGPPAAGGTIVIGLLSGVQNWNPYLVEDVDTAHLLGLVYPSLAIEQPDYHLHPPTFAPSLARSWTWSDDHLELTLELDPNARWEDGVPITSADVVFTWRIQTSPEIDWLFSDAKDSIETVEAVDDHTVRVRFTRVYPYQFMDLNDGFVIPAHAWSEIPPESWLDTDWSTHVLAGGPFRLVSHTPHQEITLERNPGYHRPGLPYLDRLVFRIVPSEQGLMNQLMAGEIDFVRAIPPSEIDRVRSRDDLELAIYDDRSYTHICWNTEKPSLADPRVRRALTIAIDREMIIDVVFSGMGRLGVGPVLSDFWAFDSELAPLPCDPGKARDIMAEAGWVDTDGDGVLDRDGVKFTIELLAPAENERRQDIAVLVQDDLERIGIEVEPRITEWGTMMAAMQDGDFDALVNRWEEPTQIDLEGLWHSAPPGEPTFNFGRYSNPEVDRLLAEVSGMTTFAEQKPLFDRIQELIVDDQPYTFLVENTRITAYSMRIQGARINAATPYFNIDEWYVTSVEGH